MHFYIFGAVFGAIYSSKLNHFVLVSMMTHSRQIIMSSGWTQVLRKDNTIWNGNRFGHNHTPDNTMGEDCLVSYPFVFLNNNKTVIMTESKQ
jgi:hypothetical protein